MVNEDGSGTGGLIWSSAYECTSLKDCFRSWSFSSRQEKQNSWLIMSVSLCLRLIVSSFFWPSTNAGKPKEKNETITRNDIIVWHSVLMFCQLSLHYWGSLGEKAALTPTILIINSFNQNDKALCVVAPRCRNWEWGAIKRHLTIKLSDKDIFLNGLIRLIRMLFCLQRRSRQLF